MVRAPKAKLHVSNQYNFKEHLTREILMPVALAWSIF